MINDETNLILKDDLVEENISNLKEEELFEFYTPEESKIETVASKEKEKYNSKTLDVFKRFFKNKSALIGLIIFLFLFLCALIFPLLPNYDPITIDSSNLNSSPSASHWWGTDSLGRDFWSRCWGGLRYSIALALIASTINIIIAIVVGYLTGYFDWIDRIFKPIIKILFALPSILILIIVSIIFEPSFKVMLLSLISTGWIMPSQQIRAWVLRHRNRDFVVSSKLQGASTIKVFLILFPYILGAILINYIGLFPQMIFAESTLGFLGLSTPDIPTLGNLIASGRKDFINYPSELLVPIALLIAMVVSSQMITYGFEDAFSPFSRNVSKFKMNRFVNFRSK